jgi:putative glutamine amidotransferase
VNSSARPLIGCTTYKKAIPQNQPIEVYGLMPSYTEAISAAGGVPVLIPLGLGEEELLAIFDRVDGILLPGGGDVEPDLYHGNSHMTLWGIDPERDRTEFILSRAAVQHRKPILAICRGIQVLNVALGGTLWEDIGSMLPNAIEHDISNGTQRNHLSHPVNIRQDSVLAKALGKTECRVNSIHHQAIRDVAPELMVTAHAPDNVIEGAEIPSHPFAVAVQWHPENLIGDDPAMLSLFRALVEAAAQ